MSKFANRYLRLAFYSDTHCMRFFLFLSELIWAIVLLLPASQGSLARPTYRIMHHLCQHEEIWGMVWLFSAITQFYILTTGHYHDRASVMFSCFNALLWWFVVISMYMSIAPTPPGISAELSTAVMASFIWIRSGWVAVGTRRCHADT